MRFYTGTLEGKQQLFAGFEKDPSLYKIEDYGMKFADMTELVCTITDEQKARLLNEREGKCAYALDEIQILAPIVRPRQDVGGNQAADGEGQQKEGDSRQLQLDAVSVKHQDSPSNL